MYTYIHDTYMYIHEQRTASRFRVLDPRGSELPYWRRGQPGERKQNLKSP